MTDTDSVRKAYAAGGAAITFGVLWFVSAVMTGHPPFPEKPVADIVTWYQHHRQGVYASQLLLSIGAGALVCFVGQIPHLLADVDSPARGQARVLGASTAAAFAVTIAGGWPQLALAVGVYRPGENPAPETVRLLSDLVWLHWGGLSVVVAVVAGSLSLLLLDGAIGARWVGIVGLVATVMSAVGAVAQFFPNLAGKPNSLALLGFLGFVGLALTALLTGITMLARPANRSARKPATGVGRAV
jgi:hypothetical protein